MSDQHDPHCAWGRAVTDRLGLEITGTIFYCPEHQAAMDKLLANLQGKMIRREVILGGLPEAGFPSLAVDLGPVIDPYTVPTEPEPLDALGATIEFIKKWQQRDVPRTPAGIVADQLRMSAIPMSVEMLAVRIVDALRYHLVADTDKTVWEYGVRWHGDDTGGIRMSETNLTSHDEALQVGTTRIGQYGIVQFTVEWREHRHYPDGSTWTSAWQPIGGTIRPDQAARP